MIVEHHNDHIVVTWKEVKFESFIMAGVRQSFIQRAYRDIISDCLPELLRALGFSLVDTFTIEGLVNGWIIRQEVEDDDDDWYPEYPDYPQ